MRPTDGAVVLGSGQRPGVVDATAARRRNLGLLRRRSGGGVVLVSAADLLWVDVIVPRGDPLWHPDVGRAFGWLGEVWRRALGVCGIVGEPHEGGYEPGAWGSLVCFAGRGPGEVLVGGRKVVGLSQRRTAGSARLQCGVPLNWAPADLAGLLALPDGAREDLRVALEACASAPDVAAGRLLAAFVAELGAAAPGGRRQPRSSLGTCA